jgi:hypothetical protein
MLGQGIQSMHIEKSAIKIIVDEIIAENPTICRMADNLDVLNTDVAVLKGDVADVKLLVNGVSHWH